MKKKKYIPTNKYILRTPLLPINYFYDLTSSPDLISDEKFKEIFKDKKIIEAIFLASPTMYFQIEKFLKDQITNIEKKERLKNSTLKYISRMSSRCTPYGLFAGCSVGEYSEITNIILNNTQKYKRHTRLDMNYVVFLSYEMIKNNEIKKRIKFFPNSSLYKVNNKYRYIEYYYKKNNRYYDIVAIESSDYLDKIIQNTKNGLFIDDIIELVIDNNVDYETAYEFIEELIDSQVLVSELEPSVTGAELFSQLRFILKERIPNSLYIDFINSIEEKLKNIDLNIGNEIKKFIEISNSIQERENYNYDLKYLFQCDLVISNEQNTINRNIIKDVESTVYFLNKIRKKRNKSNLDNFKEAFYERYEGHEMPILKVLDPEIGIGYGQNAQSNDDNPLIDDLLISQPANYIDTKEIKWSVIDKIIQKKIIESIEKHQQVIKIEDNDFSFLPEISIDELPDTISFILEIVKEGENHKIKFNGGGGGSGANLLARFCHADKKIHEYVDEIINLEDSSHKIIAEIVHLPEARVGNILSRPDLRSYEIPYLARSIKSKENQISLEDIMVSIRNNKIFLRSKLNNKEIIPKLTNAHNYSNSNSLPIYNFLCDLQSQSSNNLNGVFFDSSVFESLYKFVPRIEYKNVILSYATWILEYDDYKLLINAKKIEDLKAEIKNLKSKFHLPDFFVLADGDNELLINSNNISYLKMFVDVIKNRSVIKLNEFIFLNKDSIVEDREGNYFTNEIIMTFYKNRT